MKIWGYVQELEAFQESRDFSLSLSLSLSRSLSLSLCVCACVCISSPSWKTIFSFFISLVRVRQFHRRHEQITVNTAWTESSQLSALPGEDILICPFGAQSHSWFQQLWSERMSHVGQRWIQRNHPYEFWGENPGHHHPQGDTPQFSYTLKLSLHIVSSWGNYFHSLIHLFIYLCVHYL